MAVLRRFGVPPRARQVAVSGSWWAPGRPRGRREVAQDVAVPHGVAIVTEAIGHSGLEPQPGRVRHGNAVEPTLDRSEHHEGRPREPGGQRVVVRLVVPMLPLEWIT